MAKRKATRAESEDSIRMRVALPFIHRGQRVLRGDIIECSADEADGALFHGWAVPLANGDDAARYNRRDMRAKSS